MGVAMRTSRAIYEEWLVVRSQAGDAEALDGLVRIWHPRLLVLARSWSRDDAAAADAVQEAWISITRGLRKVRDPATFGAWAARIVKRRCADEARKEKRVSERAKRARPPVGVEGRGVSAELDEAIAALDSASQTLLRLHYGQGMGLGQIAAVLGVPEGTVKSRLFRARGAIARRLGSEGESDG